LHSPGSEIDVHHQISISATAAVLFMISHSVSAAPAAEDACPILSQAQVSAALGVPVDAGKQIGPSNALCGWNQPNDPSRASSFQVRVYGFPADQIRAIEKTLAQEVLGKL
jgi:hypothetical protein